METTLGADIDLKKYSDEPTILSLISGVKDSYSEVYVWRLVGKSKHLACVKIECVRKSRGDFCIVPDEGQDRLVQELMGGKNHIDLYVPDSSILLRCNIKEAEAPYRYYLQLPEFIAQVDRRKSQRLNVYKSSNVTLSFGKSVVAPKHMSQHFLKNCFDISSGGFSFFVSRLESKFFQTNDPIRGIEFKIGDWSTKVTAEVAFVKEIEPDESNGLTYKVWRVCCRFNQIDSISKKYIERYIFEQIKDELHAINA